MTTILADVVWPALFLEARLLSIWVILGGLLIEYFFVWRITTLGAVKAIWANLAMNAASTLLGIVLIPGVGFLVALFPGELFGTLSPVTWVLTLIVAVLLNTLIESLILWKGFKQKIGKKEFWLLGLANALSVALALGTLLIDPIEV
jgi:hypothetical protein